MPLASFSYGLQIVFCDLRVTNWDSRVGVGVGVGVVGLNGAGLQLF